MIEPPLSMVGRYTNRFETVSSMSRDNNGQISGESVSHWDAVQSEGPNCAPPSTLCAQPISPRLLDPVAMRSLTSADTVQFAFSTASGRVRRAPAPRGGAGVRRRSCSEARYLRGINPSRTTSRPRATNGPIDREVLWISSWDAAASRDFEVSDHRASERLEVRLARELEVKRLEASRRAGQPAPGFVATPLLQRDLAP